MSDSFCHGEAFYKNTFHEVVHRNEVTSRIYFYCIFLYLYHKGKPRVRKGWGNHASSSLPFVVVWGKIFKMVLFIYTLFHGSV